MTEPQDVPRTRNRRYLRWVLLLIAAGLVLRARALFVGFITDDYLQLSMLDGSFPVPRAGWDLFRFAHDDPAERLALLDAGFLPWWSAPHLRLGMFRPLASLDFALDVHLFGAQPVAHHFHSALWWVAMVAGVAAVARRSFPLPLAITAVAVFVADECHGRLLTWLANRSALMATAFGIWALWAHLRWRRERWGAGRWVSLVLAAAALACGEYAIPVLGFVVAFELAGARDSRGDRVRAAAPVLVLGLGYVVARAGAGVGMHHSGIYTDPTADPGGFAVAVLTRGPALVADLVLGVPARWWHLGSPWADALKATGFLDTRTWKSLPNWTTVHVAMGAVAIGAGLVLLRFARGGQRHEVQRTLNWLALGSLLAIVPVVGSYPSSRLLLAAQIGASPVFAAAALRGWSHARRFARQPRPRPGRSRVLALVMGGFVVWAHLWHAPRQGLDQLVQEWNLFTVTRRALLHPRVDALAEKRRWVILSAVDQSTAHITPYLRRAHGRRWPEQAWLLSAAPHPHDIARVDDRTLEMTILGGTWLAGGFERLFRGPGAPPLRRGDVVETPGFTAEVLQTRGDGLRRVRFTFVEPPGPDTVFLQATGDGLQEVELPPIGGKIRLKKAAYPYGAAQNTPKHRATLRREGVRAD